MELIKKYQSILFVIFMICGFIIVGMTSMNKSVEVNEDEKVYIENALIEMNERYRTNYELDKHVAILLSDKKYNELLTTLTTDTNDFENKVTIYMMFSCIHCYNMEMELSKLLSDNRLIKSSAFDHQHIVSNRNLAQADLLYRIKQIDNYLPLLTELMKAVHVHKVNILDFQALGSIMDALNISKEDQNKILTPSNDIQPYTQDGLTIARYLSINSTPTVVVNGKYIVNRNAFNSHTEVLTFAHNLSSILNKE